MQIFQESYQPFEFQNLDKFLISIKQAGTMTEYRLEFARHVARITDRPENALPGAFIEGLKAELKSKIWIHKPRSVFKAPWLLNLSPILAYPKAPNPPWLY